ncbi:hypothetical protein EDD11_007625 [Mortierella claussenii]|nr:hypothetical protein EDD11_007625 [Mortierella claussenii]
MDNLMDNHQDRERRDPWNTAPSFDTADSSVLKLSSSSSSPPSSPSSPSLSPARLPNECLYKIVAHLSKDIRTLHSLLLVNRFFFHAALPHLMNVLSWEDDTSTQTFLNEAMGSNIDGDAANKTATQTSLSYTESWTRREQLVLLVLTSFLESQLLERQQKQQEQQQQHEMEGGEGERLDQAWIEKREICSRRLTVLQEIEAVLQPFGLRLARETVHAADGDDNREELQGNDEEEDDQPDYRAGDYRAGDWTGDWAGDWAGDWVAGAEEEVASEGGGHETKVDGAEASEPASGQTVTVQVNIARDDNSNSMNIASDENNSVHEADGPIVAADGEHVLDNNHGVSDEKVHTKNQQCDYYYTTALQSSLTSMLLHYNLEHITAFMIDVTKTDTYFLLANRMESLKTISLRHIYTSMSPEQFFDLARFIRLNQSAFPRKAPLNLDYHVQWCHYYHGSMDYDDPSVLVEKDQIIEDALEFQQLLQGFRAAKERQRLHILENTYTR